MNFLLNPYIPIGRVRLMIADYRIGKDIISSLENRNIKVILTCPSLDIMPPINGHADMVLHDLGGGTIVVAPNVISYYRQMLTPYGFDVVSGKTVLSSYYPWDIPYNVLRIGSLAFHNSKYTDPVLCSELKNRRVQLISVKQGYSKCSVCVINEKTAISSDKKMAEIMESCGIKTLYLETDKIELPGFLCGFFGGASGMLAPSLLGLTGSIKNLNENERIKSFLEENNIELIELSKGNLVDFGSLIPLFEED